MTKAFVHQIALIAILTLVPRLALAQGLGAASVAGIVKDASGAVLPGVTVEAASPVLIEKVRTTVTDSRGALSAGRTAARHLHRDLHACRASPPTSAKGCSSRPTSRPPSTPSCKVGELTETIVVSGQTPLVDTRSVSKAQVISQETLSALPTAKSVGSMLAFVPGAVSPANGVDSGGSKGEQSVRISVFGARPNDQRQMTNGLMYTNLNGDGGGRLYFVNPVTIQENVIDLGAAGSALYQTSGAVVNTIPREGGNRFSGTGFGAYTNHNLQANNLSDDLKAWGLTVVNGVRKIYDANGLFGGPLVKDKWWFVASGRRSGSTLRAASLFHDANLNDWIYTPDTSRPVDPVEYNRNYQFRTTFQIGTKDKFGASTDIQRHYRDQAFGQLDQGIARVEANAAMCHNDSLTQFTWSRPQSNSMLFEGGGSISLNAFGTANFGTALDGSDYEECGQSEPFRVNIADAARGANYHGVGAIGIGISNLFVGRFATSYVTGAHNFKTGLYFIRGNVTGNTINRADDVGGLPISYTFTNGVADRADGVRGPRHRRAHEPRPGALCAGFVDDAAADPQPRPALRLDHAARRRSRAPGQRAVRGVQRRRPSSGTPNWKDLSPRIGAAYDLFGNGKTAIKGGINRYVQGASIGVASLYGPTATSSTARNWTDSNGNFFPDCDLKNGAAQNLTATGGDICGAFNTPSVGTYVPSQSVIDPNFTQGWFKRGYNWRATATVEQQLTNNLAVAATYARAIYGNFQVTDNLNLSPADFDPYCITLPADPRLSRSGQQLCGLYDQRANVATSNLIGVRRQLRRQVQRGQHRAAPAHGAVQRLRRPAERAVPPRDGRRRLEHGEHHPEHGDLRQRRRDQQLDQPVLRGGQPGAADEPGDAVRCEQPVSASLPLQRFVRAAVGRSAAGRGVPGPARSAHRRQPHLHERGDQRAGDRRARPQPASGHPHASTSSSRSRSSAIACGSWTCGSASCSGLAASDSRPTWTSTIWPTRARRRSSGTPTLRQAR